LDEINHLVFADQVLVFEQAGTAQYDHLGNELVGLFKFGKRHQELRPGHDGHVDEYYQWLGYARPEPMGQPLYAVVHPDDAPKVAKLILLLGQGQPLRYVDEKKIPHQERGGGVGATERFDSVRRRAGASLARHRNCYRPDRGEEMVIT
jgi:hypothetical protein